MAGTLTPDEPSYNHFRDGYNSRINPMSDVDKRILDFATKVSNNPSVKAHGQILRNFGMYPPEFWTRAQNLGQHPHATPEQQDAMNRLSSDPSRPGPMSGGANVKTDGKSFSHGLEW